MTVKDEVKLLMANRGVDVLSEDGETVTFVGRGNRKVSEYDFSQGSYADPAAIVAIVSGSLHEPKSD